MKKIMSSIALYVLLCSVSAIASNKDSKENTDLRNGTLSSHLSNSVDSLDLRSAIPSSGLASSVDLTERLNRSAEKDREERIARLEERLKKQDWKNICLSSDIRELRIKSHKEPKPTKEDYILPKPWLNIWVATGLNALAGFVTGWLTYNQFQILGKAATHKIVLHRNPQLPKLLENISKPTGTLTDKLELIRINNEFQKIEMGLHVTTAVIGAGLFAWRAYTSAKNYQDQYNTKKTYNQRYKQLKKEDPLQAHRLKDLNWKPLSINQIIKDGDVEALKVWLEYKKHKINQCDKDGKTPLYKAAIQNKLKIAKLLLDNGAKNEKTTARVSPLQAVHWLGQMKHSVDGGSYKEMHALLAG